MKSAIVIGGGWAGCAAAVELAEKGFQVSLLEGSNRLGGRASSFVDAKTGSVMDNGQHLFMGCYSATIQLLKKIGTLSKLKFQKDLSVAFVNKKGEIFSLHCRALPAPVHLFSGLLGLGTLSLSEKIAMGKVYQAVNKWRKNNEILSPEPALSETNVAHNDSFSQMENLKDLTVDEWLRKCGQSEKSRKYFWDLITIATLNEQASIACAESMAVILSEAFFSDKSKSKIAISTVGLSQLLDPACEEFLKQRGGKILKNHLVTKVLINEEQLQGILLRDSSKQTADFYVSALPFHLLGGLLGEPALQTNFFSKIRELKTSPILSISLWFDRAITSREFLGMLDTQVQWLFNKGKILQTDEENRYLSLVISGAHNYLRLSDEEILKICLDELYCCFPESQKAKLLHSRVLREKNATLSPQVGSSQYRLPQKTPIKNFFLCGDWTDTGFPATIESAVASGVKVAEWVHAAARI